MSSRVWRCEYCAFKTFPTANVFSISFVSAPSWQFLFIQQCCAKRLLQWGDKHTHTHTLIEINGFPRCSMLTVHHCSTERIHQNQPCALHNLQPPPTLTHWFPTHGGVMPECDYKMPFDASMTDTWPSHVTYILCIWISCSWKQCFIIPISPVFCLRGMWPPSMLLFWDHHTPLWHCL